MKIKQAIEEMQHWIDYEKQNKDKINQADKLIEIQETIINHVNKSSRKLTPEERTAIVHLQRELTDEDRREYFSPWFAHDLDLILNIVLEIALDIRKGEK